MIKYRVVHILQASAIATVAIAFSGVAMAADTSVTSTHSAASDQAIEAHGTQVAGNDTQNIVVQVSSTSNQSADATQSVSGAPTNTLNQHDAKSSTVSKESSAVVAVDAGLNSESKVKTDSAQAATLTSFDPKAVSAIASSTHDSVEPARASLVSSAHQYFVSQTPTASVSTQSALATQSPLGNTVQTSTPASNPTPAPVSSDMPSLPGSIAQRLNSTLSTYSTTLFLFPVSSSSSSLPAILSLLLTVGFLGLVAVGSLYLLHMHTSGFLGAGRAVPFFTFVTDHMMSFTGTSVVLASSFFNRQNIQTTNTMHI